MPPRAPSSTRRSRAISTRPRPCLCPVTLVILVVAFGAIVAAGVPVLLAISAVLATIGLVSIPSQIFPIDDNASIVITLIGMAVGVDYSLFYLKRQREERAAGHDEETAVGIASATSGRAILISGFTVMVAMAGQFLTGDKASTSFAVGTIMVVAVAMLGSLTALPAALALLGRHVDKGRIRVPFRRRAPKQQRVPGLGRRARRGCCGGRRPRRRSPWSVLLAIASPALHFKVHNTGVNDLPPDMPGIATSEARREGVPERRHAGDGRRSRPTTRRAPPCSPPSPTCAGRRSKSGAVHAAHRRHHRQDPHGRGAVDAARRQRHQRGLQAGADTLRDRLDPRTLGTVDGVGANVTGETAIDRDSDDDRSPGTPRSSSGSC